MRNLNPFSCMAKKPTQPRFFPPLSQSHESTLLCFHQTRPAKWELYSDRGNQDRVGLPLPSVPSSIMERINQVGVERTAKYLEVGVPLRAAKNDDMVLVHGTDSRGNPLIKRLKLRIVLPQLLEMRNWLVQ